MLNKDSTVANVSATAGIYSWSHVTVLIKRVALKGVHEIINKIMTAVIVRKPLNL